MDVRACRKNRDATGLSHLTSLIYEAALRPDKWNTALAALAATFDCTKALLFTPHVPPQRGGLVFPYGISDAAMQLWAGACIDQDRWTEAVARGGRVHGAGVMLDEKLVAREELLQPDFHRELFSKVGIGRACTGFVSGNEPGLMATALSVFRSADDAPFDAADVAWMQLLVSHVSRSLGLMQRCDKLRLQQAALLAAYDGLEFGVVLLDAEMRVSHVNAAARAVLARRDGLAIGTSRQLESTTGPLRQPRLASWMDKVRAMPPAKRVHFLDGCRVPRKDGDSYYVVQCSALAADGEWCPGQQDFQYVAFITDPSALRLPGEDRLMQLFGLTQAQARVALAFADGASYKDVARSHGISEETVRSHVKEIYPKTRVNRQADLVRLVLSLAHSAI